jgi:hypothetical protein
MTLPRADGDCPIFHRDRKLVGNLWILASRTIKTFVEQLEDGGPDRRPTILALASGRRAGGEAADGAASNPAQPDIRPRPAIRGATFKA